MDDFYYNELIKYIKRHISFDGNIYKERPFNRRLKLRMRRTKNTTFKEYLDYLKKNHEELDKLKDTLTINVTRFYRNRETFEYLEYYIKNDILKYKKTIRICSIGCSSGEEPYTLSIILHKLQKYKKFSYNIIAVDIDTNILSKAKIGIYPDFSMIELNEVEKQKYFDEKDGMYILKNEFKKNVVFKQIDIKNQHLLKQLGIFDIIICRNVLIYFSKDFQDTIINTFHEMLTSDGVLVLGKIEILMGKNRKKYIVINKKERIYRKIDYKSENG